MNWQKIILIAILWAQTCLVIGLLIGSLTFKQFIDIQVSIIMLLLPSPLNKNND